MVCRLFDEYPIAGLDVGRQDQIDGMQRTGGDQHLVGLGGKPSLAIPFGDRPSQFADADKFVTHLVQVRRDIAGRVGERLGHRRRRSRQRCRGKAHRWCRGVRGDGR